MGVTWIEIEAISVISRGDIPHPRTGHIIVELDHMAKVRIPRGHVFGAVQLSVPLPTPF